MYVTCLTLQKKPQRRSGVRELRRSSGAWSRRKNWVVVCSLLHAIWVTLHWPGFSIRACGVIRGKLSSKKRQIHLIWLGIYKCKQQTGTQKRLLGGFFCNWCLLKNVDLFGKSINVQPFLFLKRLQVSEAVEVRCSWNLWAALQCPQQDQPGLNFPQF